MPVGVEPEPLQVRSKLRHPLATQVDAGLTLEGGVGLDEAIVHRPVVGVELDLHDRERCLNGVEDRSEALLACAQGHLGRVHSRDVARHRQQPLRLAVGPEDRRDLHVPPPGRPGHGVGHTTEMPGASRPRRGHGSLGVLVALVPPEIRPRAAADGVEVVHLHDLLPTLIHEAEPGIEVEHLDAVAGGGQDAAQELGIGPVPFGGLVLLRTVAQDLDEALDRAGRIPKRHHLAVGPEAGAVLALVPTLIDPVPLVQGSNHLGLGHPGDTVLLGEEQAGRAATDLRLGPAEDAAGTLVPFQHEAVEVERDDSVFHRAVQDHAVPIGTHLHPLLSDCELPSQLFDLGFRRSVPR